jgi:hypothetical protein
MDDRVKIWTGTRRRSGEREMGVMSSGRGMGLELFILVLVRGAAAVSPTRELGKGRCEGKRAAMLIVAEENLGRS